MEFSASPLVVRVGVVSAANIAKKNARAILRSERCALVAVASRSLEKARAWRAALGLGDDVECVEGYDALLARGDVDAVYVPLPTVLHVDFVKKAAAAGKHVLIEKPVGVDAAEVREIVAACRAAGVALLDGTMFVHHKRFKQIDRLFRDQTWRPLRVRSTFAFSGGAEFLAAGNIRTNGMDPLGCLGDVGWSRRRRLEDHRDGSRRRRGARAGESAGTGRGAGERRRRGGEVVPAPRGRVRAGAAGDRLRRHRRGRVAPPY